MALSAGENPLGRYLRERRERIDPAALGYSMGRRRTPGLRRDEVAQRAGISPTWYAWLEQGRGGAPSSDTLERVAKALLMTDSEREHLFLLGFGRPPEPRYRPPSGVTPRLQGVLDRLEASPAMIRTVTWDIIAWNHAAAATFDDYETLPAGDRNILKRLFLDPSARETNVDWENVARFLVGVFRADAARAGASDQIRPLVDELCSKCPEFERIWAENEINPACSGLKQLRHPAVGPIDLEFSSFAVDGRPDLAMLVYTPMEDADARNVQALTARYLAGAADVG